MYIEAAAQPVINRQLWNGRKICRCMVDETVVQNATLFEGGHFYSAKGPTLWSQVGWDILNSLRGPHDHAMLMVDDVHSLDDVSVHERPLPRVEFNPNPEPCFVVFESVMEKPAWEILKTLKGLSRRKRAVEKGDACDKRWYCSGYPLTTLNHSQAYQPLCLLYDLGLCKVKYELGFRRIVNVLPEFYAPQQAALIRIVRKALPDLVVESLLFDLAGNRRWLRLADIL